MGKEKLKDKTVKYKPRSGVLRPFDEKLKEYRGITGDEDVIRKAWENVEVYANRFVWMVLTDI
jgi:hypothetical protein